LRKPGRVIFFLGTSVFIVEFNCVRAG
jgi:hypothetical protein